MLALESKQAGTTVETKGAAAGEDEAVDVRVGAAWRERGKFACGRRIPANRVIA